MIYFAGWIGWTCVMRIAARYFGRWEFCARRIQNIYVVIYVNSSCVSYRVSFETSFDSKQPKLEPKLVSALSETKCLFRLFRFFADWTELNRRPTETVWYESIFGYFFIKFLVLFRFVSKQFVSVVSNSIPKQRVSMFRSNRNKQKTNRNSLIQSIFWYFSDYLGLFRFDSKQFCLFRLFRYRFETPKQTENFSFWFHETNRNTTATDLVSVCFSLNRNFFFVSRTP